MVPLLQEGQECRWRIVRYVSYPQVMRTKSWLIRVQAEQWKDGALSQIINYLEGRSLPEDAYAANKIVIATNWGYFLVNGILYHESSDSPRRRKLAVPQHLQKVVLDKGHDSVYALHFSCWTFLFWETDTEVESDVSLVSYERRCIREVCVLCNLCIYTRAGKEIQATSSQHSSPWTILLYWNGLQGGGFEQMGKPLYPGISRLSDRVARNLCNGRQEGNYSSSLLGWFHMLTWCSS